MPIERPGGRIGFREFTEPSPVAPLIQELKAAGVEIAYQVELMCTDPDFIAEFVKAVPDTQDQKHYLTHTSAFLSAQEPSQEACLQLGIDPKYVLVFRRTLPSPQPKPESHWSYDYITVRRGLRKEIPHGPHRFHSVILCSTLEAALSEGGYDTQNAAVSDGELKVISSAFDQNSVLCTIKPEEEQKALDDYLKTEGAMTAQQVREAIAAHKK